MSEIRAVWRESKVYRVLLVLAILYGVLRLGVQGFYLATMLTPEALPDWVGADEPMIPDDLRIYLDAAERLQSKQNLYIQEEVTRMEFYQYAPAFALSFIPQLALPRSTIAILHTLLHIAAYYLLYKRWGNILQRLDPGNLKVLVSTLPVWLIFSAFWSDLGYLNIYIILALLSTLLLEAVLNENLGWALFWLSIILQSKPQWAFAAAIPLLVGKWRFFLKLLSASIITYILI
ncbi:MAG: hypothetical protein K8R89_08075, partial [Anaerolineae bacterium]|nr:hypothetical protein [Anaerolineae bacterium]